MSNRSIQDHHREGSSTGFLQLLSVQLQSVRSSLQASHKAQLFGSEKESVLPTSRGSLDRVRPMYTSNIENRQHRSLLEHWRIGIRKSPMSMLSKILVLL